MRGWHRGLQRAFEEHPAIIVMAVLCLLGNAVALTVVLLLLTR